MSARPDLIVSDLVMPYRDGYEVLRAIRNDENLKATPVLILSMRDREEDIESVESTQGLLPTSSSSRSCPSPRCSWR